MMGSKAGPREVRVHVKDVCVGKDDSAVVVVGTRSRAVPIFIGKFEAGAIEAGWKGEQFERPLTHDLSVNVLGETGYRIEKLVVSRMENKTFIGELHLAKGKTKGPVLDCRPSDGIALAVRAKAPLYVGEAVMQRAGCPLAHAEKMAKDVCTGLGPTGNLWLNFLGQMADPEAALTLKRVGEETHLVSRGEDKPRRVRTAAGAFEPMVAYICKAAGLTEKGEGKRVQGTARLEGEEAGFEVKVSAYMPKRGLPKSIQVDAHKV